MSASKLHETVRFARRAALGVDGSGLGDGRLLQCFLTQREEAAFEVLLRRHGRMVLGVCQRILRDTCDAEDAFQATFLIMLRKAGSLLERQTIGDWLYGVARNTALKSRAMASKRRVKERQAAARMPSELPVEEILWQEWRPLLDQEVLRLPAKYRTLIILCDLEQKSYKEAASLTGCSAGTVAGRLSRARDLLARRLTRYCLNLSVVSLSALLAQNGAAASLPSPLLVAATNAATAWVAGSHSAAAGAIAPPVLALTQGVLKAMWMTKLKQSLAVLFLLAGIGAGAIFHQAASMTSAAAQANAANDGAEARAIIDKAVKAHGGEDKLAKFKAVSAKWEGKRKVENMFFWDAVHVVSYQMPDKIRFDTEVQNPDGKKFQVIKVVTGNKGWMGSTTRSRDMKEAEVAQVNDEMYAVWVASLAPLKDKSFDFATVGDAKVDEKDTIGVKVSRKGRPDVNLYFDKKSGLLLKSERRTKDALTGEEFTAESVFRDYKEFQGVLWATKRFDKRDGTDLEGGTGRIELSEFRALDTLEDQLFAKP